MADFEQWVEDEINRQWRGSNRNLAARMIELVSDFRKYWPMTLRAFYYQAVAKLLIENTPSSYKAMGKMLAKLRRSELLPWKAMQDKTRHTAAKRGMPDVSAFIEGQVDDFLDSRYYARCYVQEQDVYCEVTVEKDALSGLVEDAAYMYCTRVTTTKGQMSATFLEQMAGRFEAAIYKGQTPILLHFGDLDATGVQIPLSIQNGLDEHHFVEVDVRHMGLLPEHVDEFDLPQDVLSAVKVEDPNYARWLQRYPGQAPTELDALHPEHLKKLVRDSLEDVYDMSGVEKQKAIEAEEDELLQELRDGVIEFMCEQHPKIMQKAGYV